MNHDDLPIHLRKLAVEVVAPSIAATISIFATWFLLGSGLRIVHVLSVAVLAKEIPEIEMKKSWLLLVRSLDELEFDCDRLCFRCRRGRTVRKDARWSVLLRSSALHSWSGSHADPGSGLSHAGNPKEI